MSVIIDNGLSSIFIAKIISEKIEEEETTSGCNIQRQIGIADTKYWGTIIKDNKNCNITDM